MNYSTHIVRCSAHAMTFTSTKISLTVRFELVRAETLTRDRVKTENVQNVLMAFAIIREWVLPAIIVKNRSLKL